MSMFAALNRRMAAAPLTAAAVTAGMKGCCVDLAVQVVVERKCLEKVDFRRTAVFTLHGFGYVGMGQWFIFNRVFPRLFRGVSEYGAKRASWWPVVGAVAVDNFVHMPFIYMWVLLEIEQSGCG